MTNGQTRLTGAFTTARTCGFHNHDDPDEPASAVHHHPLTPADAGLGEND